MVPVQGTRWAPQRAQTLRGWGWMNSLGLGDALCLGWREVTARARWHSAVGFNLVQYLLVAVARGTAGPGPR